MELSKQIALPVVNLKHGFSLFTPKLICYRLSPECCRAPVLGFCLPFSTPFTELKKRRSECGVEVKGLNMAKVAGKRAEGF